jgi:hypothetical protein
MPAVPPDLATVLVPSRVHPGKRPEGKLARCHIWGWQATVQRERGLTFRWESSEVADLAELVGEVVAVNGDSALR